MLFLLSLPLALLLDFFLGEPKRFHPLVGFGNLADKLELRLNRKADGLWWGVLAWVLVVLPVVGLVYWLDQMIGGWWLSVICGWLAIGWQSLRQHGQWVADALLEGDITTARTKLGWIVSRDTSALGEEEISRGGIESVLENGSDAVFAALFWLAVAGAPGVVLYRLSNTLDAMWGYRNPRFERFGKFAARIDDVLNYIPARLTALTYAVAGSFTTALKSWRLQAGQWYSPNAGVVMATGAGALQVALGGNAVYHGKMKSRPTLGMGAVPKAEDMQRAIRLLDRSVLIWGIIALVLGVSSLL
ncbi:MAG: adenosylcobinamide-phosphate synthase CbiB [Thiolinea sp.]